MCHKGTGTAAGRLVFGVLFSLAIVFGQANPGGITPEWRTVGSTAVDLMLASPASGPVLSVWFSPDGKSLYAFTRSGHVFETVDFENWTASAATPPPPPTAPSVPPVRTPPGATVIAPPSLPGQLFALGNDLYRSDDGGRSWTDLTAFRNESVIGVGQNDLAISPADPDELVAANEFGVWRSMDGGLSWSGLNQFLPNLMVRHILATPDGMSGTKVVVNGIGPVEWLPGNSAWLPVHSPQLDAEAQTKQKYSATLGAVITAVASSGETVYAGASDGRIWVSFDDGKTWPVNRPASGNRVESIYVDPTESRVALAALSGSGAHVLRTTNSGAFWDDLSSNLPNVSANGVTADRAAGAVYVATDDGVFYARVDLENADPAAPSWVSLTSQLPRAPATDVQLDAGGNQLYIALAGYGIYATMAPHWADALRLVNAADFSSRPAAPGSLLSVLGARVNAASAGGLRFPVLAASNAESQIQVPFETTGSSVAVALQSSRGRFTLGLPVRPVSPAIFVGPDGLPMLLNADSGLMLDARNVAHSNSRVQILATGLGRVNPDWPTGVAAPLQDPPAVQASVRAYLDREPVDVTRATLAPGYIGFYLIEVQLPAIVNAGPAELYITADGQESNRVQIFLAP